MGVKKSQNPKGFSEVQAPLHIGHRERLKHRFNEHGPRDFSDAEFLELILFRSIPRRDTKPLARLLIDRFGSFAEVVSAPADRLREVKGVGDSIIHDLKLLQASAGRIARGELKERPVLNSWSKLLEYCRISMGLSETEEFRILFLDRRNNLLADEVQQRGTIDHTPVYPREVIKRTLELSAAAIILVHNHPSGDPTPSSADIRMTSEIAAIADQMGIALHDHVIISRDKHVSFKGLKLL